MHAVQTWWGRAREAVLRNNLRRAARGVCHRIGQIGRGFCSGFQGNLPELVWTARHAGQSESRLLLRVSGKPPKGLASFEVKGVLRTGFQENLLELHREQHIGGIFLFDKADCVIIDDTSHAMKEAITNDMLEPFMYSWKTAAHRKQISECSL